MTSSHLPKTLNSSILALMIAQYLSMYILPGVVIVICYVTIASALRRSAINRRQLIRATVNDDDFIRGNRQSKSAMSDFDSFQI